MMLQAKNLGVRAGERWLAREIDLTLAPGELVSVLGPNGAGKTTLLRALTGELCPSHGCVHLDGRPLDAWPARERGRRLAVLPQHSAPAFGFSVLELVLMGRLPHQGRDSRSESRRIALDALRLARAAHLVGRSCLTLSGGERQRVQLARVLAQAAGGGLLLLDEPLASLDIAHQLELMHLLHRLTRQQGHGILAVMHDLNLAARFSDRLLILRAGRMLAHGAPDDVLNEAMLDSAYDIQARVTRHPRGDCPHVIFG